MCTIKLGKTIILTDINQADDISDDELNSAYHILYVDTKTDVITCIKTSTSKLKGIWKNR